MTDPAEVLRLFYEAFSRRDVDGVLRYLHPDVELYPGIDAPDQEARYRGLEGLRAFFESTTEAWETVTAEPVEMLEAPGGRILVFDRWQFRGRDGIAIDDELVQAYTFKDGLISRIDGFADRDAALTALGLAE